jgi:hypothetical protein
MAGYITRCGGSSYHSFSPSLSILIRSHPTAQMSSSSTDATATVLVLLYVNEPSPENARPIARTTALM